jgi:orotidine-5'-phosphate decarboxylase
MESKVNNSRIIVSLDFADAESALQLIDKLDAGKCRLKVGKELFTRVGPQFVEELVRRDFDVFLDLKYHDIPNTVARACSAAAELGVWMLNVHASGGREMLSRARQATNESSNKPLLIAVTVLTSLSSEDLSEIGLEQSTDAQVRRLASLSQSAGLDGIVCSAQEAAQMRENLGVDFKLVTPGIRLADGSHDDQKRIMTPAKAISAGSDYLVVGRPITQAKDPLQVLLEIESEIESVTTT